MRTKTKKKIAAGLVAVVTIVVGYSAIAKWQGFWPFVKSQDQPTNETIDSSKKQGANQAPSDKKSIDKNDTEPGLISQDGTTDAPSKRPDDQKPKHSRQLVITSQGVDPEGNYELRVAANLVAVASAKCELVLNNKLIETVEVQALPNSSACKGFLISKSVLQKGQNKFQVRFTSGDYTDVVEGEIKGD